MGKHTKKTGSKSRATLDKFKGDAVALALVSLAKTARRELRRIASANAASSEVARLGVEMLAEMKCQLEKIYAGLDCLVSVAVQLRDQPAPARNAVPGVELRNLKREPIPAEQLAPGFKLYLPGGECSEVLGATPSAVLLKMHGLKGCPGREIGLPLDQWAAQIKEFESKQDDLKPAALAAFAAMVRLYPVAGDGLYLDGAKLRVMERGPGGNVEIEQLDETGTVKLARSLGWWRDKCDQPGASLYSNEAGEYVSGEMLTTAQELDAAEIEKAGRA